MSRAESDRGGNDADRLLIDAVRAALARGSAVDRLQARDPESPELDDLSDAEITAIMRAIAIPATTGPGLKAKAEIAEQWTRGDVLIPVLFSIARDLIAIIEATIGLRPTSSEPSS